MKKIDIIPFSLEEKKKNKKRDDILVIILSPIIVFFSLKLIFGWEKFGYVVLM